ncbi:MAG: L-aspartate oxidase [Leptolyngbyaceae cyanobacterium MO_188.B28]|nr:L-aspartate oxidase [Leptolyngbyaceae cyanobacterium MO_188.B28]
MASTDLPFPTRFDVLVVGGGAAGLYAALCLPPSLKIGLITKDTFSLSASDWAQGGIAAAIASNDSSQLHRQDTLKVGCDLCDLDAVDLLVDKASACINSLVEMGVLFDRQGERLALTLEAAHSRPRVLHAADTTGRAVVSTLTAKVIHRPNIQVLPQTFALELWRDSASGDCQGMSLAYRNQIVWVRAGAVVLATGGGGQVFSKTTNPISSTGDGVAIAWRAGAKLRDLEFVQFHPTALNQPGAPRFLISEAVRGEGAYLIDASGRRFAFDYHPEGELAPRDVVSRAIFNHLRQTTTDEDAQTAWLDLRSIEPERMRHRFPNIIKVCQKWGVDPFLEPIPISPAAHYWMGGIVTDLDSRTSIPRLYAVGENASTGVHGANRLASNSLLECLVFGAQLKYLQVAPYGAKGEQGSIPAASFEEPMKLARMDAWEDDLNQLRRWRQDLSTLLWQSAGICRDQPTMAAACEQVEQWRQDFQRLQMSQILDRLPIGKTVEIDLPEGDQCLRVWAETRNLLDIALLILKSALFRTESRGGHYRSDFPKTDPAWRVHTLVEGDQLGQSPV